MIKFFYNEEMEEFRWGHIIGSVVALIVAIILAFSMIKTVPTGYTGILREGVLPKTVLGENNSFMINLEQ